MPGTIEPAKYYETLTDDSLLNLAREGGFTEEARQALSRELERRRLSDSDLKRFVGRNDRINLREEAKEKGFRGRGPGLLFFGRRFLNEADKKANIQVRTKFFALGGIPLIPVASYRFKCTGRRGRWFSPYEGNQRVINRVPLNWTQVFLTWIKTTIIFVAVLLLVVGVHEAVIRLK